MLLAIFMTGSIVIISKRLIFENDDKMAMLEEGLTRISHE